MLDIDFGKFKKERSYWKFNNSLLHDKDYINQIKQLIIEIKRRYAADIQLYEGTIEEIPNDQLQFSINDQLFLEVLLMEIRGNSISYASFVKNKYDNLEEKLLQEIQVMESEVIINHNELENKHTELKKIRQRKLEGVRIRSKAKWVDEGEKVTNYFCNRENRNFVSRCLFHLVSNAGQALKTQEEILHETYNFYKTLYSSKEIEDFNLKEEFRNFNIKVLSDEEKISSDTPITYKELTEALRKMKNDKSPGSDGFSSNFYKFFWKDIGHFVLRSLNYGFLTNELSVTQKQGIITCIPKGDKDKNT